MTTRRAKTTVASTAGSYAPGGQDADQGAVATRFGMFTADAETRPYLTEVYVDQTDAQQEQRLRKRVDDINKMLAKVDVEPLKLTKSGTVVDDEGLAYEVWDVTGAIPSGGSNGREPLMMLEWEQAAERPLVRSFQGSGIGDESESVEAIALARESRSDKGLHCDVCGKERHRKQAIVFRDADGNLGQAGGACAKPFLAGTWQNTMNLQNAVEDLETNGGGLGGGTASEYPPIPMDETIGRLMAVREAEGRPESDYADHQRQMREEQTDRVTHAIATGRDPSGMGVIGQPDEDPAYTATAPQIREFMRDHEASGQGKYLQAWSRSMNILAGAKSVAGPKQVRVLWGAINAYKEEQRREAAKAARNAELAEAAKSQYYGTTPTKVNGKRVPGTAMKGRRLTVTDLYEGYSDFGSYTWVTFSDEDGNVIKWKASYSGGLKIGETVDITGGRVKEHTGYTPRGSDVEIQQTRVSHIKYKRDSEDD